MTDNQKQLKVAFTSNSYKHKEELKGYKEQEVWSGSGLYKEDKKQKPSSDYLIPCIQFNN